MDTLTNEQLKIKDTYEPGDKVMTINNGRGEVINTRYEGIVPVYAVRFENDPGNKVYDCLDWEIMGALEPAMSIRDKMESIDADSKKDHESKSAQVR